MTPDALAAIHALCFDAAPRPWRAEEFAALAGEASTLLEAEPGGGFALAWVAGPEAELLTLAVVPAARRQGLGRRLLAAVERAAAARGAAEMFLEVAETNRAARALYAGAGYAAAGFRRDYYAAAGARRVSALVLQKALVSGARAAPDTGLGAAGDND